MSNIKVTNVSITEHIETHYRDYAIYVLEKRGIPNWYDGLTPVQRQVLNITPTTTTKTLGLVGKVIQNGYNHGNSSLEGAINKMTRTFNTSKNLLDGEGFFGTPVTPRPSAARYTDVKLSSEIATDLKEFKHLNEFGKNGKTDYLHLRYPIGILTNIVGIAIGYKTLILPRKKEDVIEYLNGKRKSIRPNFMNYKGSIRKVQNENSTWLFSAKIEVDKKSKQITITNLPPLLKQISYLKKLERIRLDLAEINEDIIIQNYSDEFTKIIVSYKGDNFDNFVNLIEVKSKMVVKEILVFVKDGKVMQYECIEDYLNDYKIHYENILYKNLKYKVTFNEDELRYFKAKKKFVEFMLKSKRTRKEVSNFMTKYKSNITSRLQSIKLHHVDTESIKEIIEIIKVIEASIKKYLSERKIQYDKYLNMKSLHTSKVMKSITSNDYDEPMDIVKGVETFNIEIE